MAGGTLYTETYGCTFNLADTRFIEAEFLSRGWRLVSRPEEADVIIVNTCVVRLDTELAMVRRLKRLRKYLEDGKRIVVTGCMVTALPSLIAENLPGALMLSPSALDEVYNAVVGGFSGYFGVGLPGRRADIIPPYRGELTYILPIGTGCIGSCSFCIVKVARGRLRSYSPDGIYRAFRAAVRGGAKEVYLTSQDTAVYGLDIGYPLPKLLRLLLRVPGEYRVRIGMFNPLPLKLIIDDLLPIYRDPRVYKFVHLPVQSGDDGVLRAMRRGYTVSDFLSLVKKIRSSVPDVQLVTDIIVGYPGETEEAFENTLRLVEKVRPDRVHVARFTSRPHTPASALKQLPDDVKKRRSRILTELVQKIAYENNLRYVGRELRVLVVGRSPKGQIEARSDDYRVVILEKGGDKLIGKFIYVEIVDAGPFYLKGVPVSS